MSDEQRAVIREFWTLLLEWACAGDRREATPGYRRAAAMLAEHPFLVVREEHNLETGVRERRVRSDGSEDLADQVRLIQKMQGVPGSRL